MRLRWRNYIKYKKYLYVCIQHSYNNDHDFIKIAILTPTQNTKRFVDFCCLRLNKKLIMYEFLLKKILEKKASFKPTKKKTSLL